MRVVTCLLLEFCANVKDWLSPLQLLPKPNSIENPLVGSVADVEDAAHRGEKILRLTANEMIKATAVRPAIIRFLYFDNENIAFLLTFMKCKRPPF